LTALSSVELTAVWSAVSIQDTNWSIVLTLVCADICVFISAAASQSLLSDLFTVRSAVKCAYKRKDFIVIKAEIIHFLTLE
jgi:hypothetical protein